MEPSNSTEECRNSSEENEPECYAVLVGMKRKSSSPEETSDEEYNHDDNYNNDDNCEQEVNFSCDFVGKRRIENVGRGNGYPITPRDQIIRRDLRLRTPWAPRRNPNQRRKYGIIHVRQPDYDQELTPFDVLPYNASI